MLAKLFHAHGLCCASHPWEVIVFVLTLTLCGLSIGSTLNSPKICVWSKNCTVNDLNKNADVVIMTVTRCMAVLYIYHQFRTLRKLGSKYVLGISGLFTVFSSFVFSSSVINFLQGDLAELNEALPFFFLLIDLSKASLLAQFALTSSNQQEVRDNIARGMALLGPTITLDTVVETLVIGVGTLSGIKRLEVMCCFACLSVIVNYVVFMTFFPACLSLVLELSRDRDDHSPVWQLNTFARALHEKEQKPNPVLQRVKVIMSAGLVLVHAHSRWPLFSSLNATPRHDTTDEDASYIDEDSTLGRWLSVSPDQLVMMVLVLALAIKYIFFESRDNVADLISPEITTPRSTSSSSSSSIRQDSTSPPPSSAICSSCSSNPVHEEKINRLSKMTQTCKIMTSVKENVITLPPPSATENVKISRSSNLPFCTRSLDECFKIVQTSGAELLTDDEIISLVNAKRIPSYVLEKKMKDKERAVSIRRKVISAQMNLEEALKKLPFSNYDYSKVTGVCCENVIGYVTIPLGIAGPLLMNGRMYMIPMATTEGCLVASTNRGCRALTLSGGVTCTLLGDSMTRGPVVRFSTGQRAGEVMKWLQVEENFKIIKQSFDSSSRFARLLKLEPVVSGPLLFIRFEAKTGDAMGMNMLSKGTETALMTLRKHCSDMEIVSLSGNFCTDKKPAAINWINGRGKKIVCEAVIPAHVVEDYLKTSVSKLVDLNYCKNFVGSSMSGAVGGNNAQAANIVTAIFIATGQDPAQNVTSSNCLTHLERHRANEKDLFISCTMRSLEVGTIGGGTLLEPQSGCLEILGVKGSCDEQPGHNAATLACIIGGAVLAGELSLLTALSKGELVNSHLMLNRASENIKMEGEKTSQPISNLSEKLSSIKS